MKKYLILILIALCLLCTSCKDEHTHEFVDGICDCGEKDPNYKHKSVTFGLAPGIKKFSFATEDEIKKFFTYIKEEEYEKYLFYFVRDGKYVPNFIKKEKRYAKYLT